MYNSCGNVLFLVSAATLITDITTDEVNWFQAQEKCRDRGGLTTNRNKSNQLYWTGRYKRITPWIKIKGCFKDSYLSSNTNEMTIPMLKKSVGNCQEICQRNKTRVFAVKANNCVCIQPEIQFSYNATDPNRCNFNCSRGSGGIYGKECGGNSSYNVFEFELSSAEQDSNNEYRCLSLQCSDIKYIAENCLLDLQKACQNKGNHGNAGNWMKAMNDCKTTNPSSYLFGDVDLQNPRLACNKTILPKKVSLGWIGVARQFYKNRDIGWDYSDDDKKWITHCQACSQDNCSYQNCNLAISSSVFCTNTNSMVSSVPPSSLMDTTPVDTDILTHTQSYFSSRYITRYTTEPKTLVNTQVPANYTSHKSGADNSSSDLELLLPIVAVVGLLLILAVMLIFYLRRKKMKRNEGTDKKPVELTSPKITCDEKRGSSCNSYFVLEKPSQDISNRGPLITESPYNDTEEGEYDHLRDTRSRKDKQEEDTYQHASAGISNDVSDYDTMTNSSVIKMAEEEGTYDHAHTSVNKMSEEDGTYDHARPVNIRNSDYGYSMPSHGSCNDNPYDIAESKS